VTENHLSSRVVAIGLSDQLLYLLRNQSAYGGSVFRSNDICAPNRGLFELNGEISSGHASILREH
jgi:hypothetical protein